MPGGYGSAKNGIRIGVFWDGIQINAAGTQARITDPHVTIKRDVNIIDTANTLHVSGGAVADHTYHDLSCSGSGEKRIKTLDATWVTLTAGATTTVQFDAELSGINYAGGTLTVDKTVTFPAKAVSVPAAPTSVSATRVSDVQGGLTWTPTVSADAPYTNQHVERADNGGGFVRIATLTGAATSYADLTLTTNARYQYRVQGANSAGVGAYGTSGLIYTTPAAPTGMVASKTGTSVNLMWANPALYATSVKVYHSADGGAYSLLDTLAGTATSYTHSGVNTAQTHAYRVTTVIGALESAALQSPTITLLSVPSAPTVTVSPAVGDLTVTDVEVEWTHRPTDNTAQTNAEVQVRAVGAGSWTSHTGLLTADSYTIAAGTLGNGSTYEVQVRTKGDHATYSAWSASTLFRGSATPSATITFPTAADVETTRVTVAWTYTDPEATAQSAWQVDLYNATDVLIQNWSGSGAAASFDMPYTLTNLTDYSIGVTVWDGDGLASTQATVAFSVDFPPPPTPIITSAVFNEDTGATEVAFMVPVPVAGQATPTKFDLNRDGVPIYTGALFADFVAYRTNLAPNPSFEESVDDWNAWNSTQTQSTEQAWVGSGSMKVVMDIGGEDISFNGDIPAKPGTTYTVSIYIKATSITDPGSNPTVELYGICRGPGGSLLDSFTLDSQPLVVNGSWLRLSGQITTVPYTEWLDMTVSSWDPGDGSVVYLDGLMVEEAGAVGDYFDGDTADTAELTYSWQGTPHQSASVQLGTAVDTTTLFDPIPPLNDTLTYTVTVWSDLPTSAPSNPATVDSTSKQWVYLNGGTDYATLARLKGNPAVDMAVGREKVLHQFAGRTKPVEYIGEARTRVLDLSGDVSGMGARDEIGTWQPFEVVADLPAPICYRDPLGRRLFVSIGDVTIKHTAQTDLASVSMTLTEVDD